MDEEIIRSLPAFLSLSLTHVLERRSAHAVVMCCYSSR